VPQLPNVRRYTNAKIAIGSRHTIQATSSERGLISPSITLTRAWAECQRGDRLAKRGATSSHSCWLIRADLASQLLLSFSWSYGLDLFGDFSC